MFHILKKIKIKAILPAAAFLAAAAIGTTFAWQTWDLDMTNELKAHTTDVSVDEDFKFDEEKGFDKKEVKFKNEGTSSVFLRCSYTEYWEKEGYILSNLLSDGSEIARKEWTKAWEEQWEEIDGWFYYKKVLKQGEPTDLILKKVTLSENFTGGKYYLTDAKYSEYVNSQNQIDAEYHLYFKVEAVQCSDGSNTLNSVKVNEDATEKMFGRKATVSKDGKGNVTWE